MVGLGDGQRCRRKLPDLIGRCMISFVFAGFTQLALLVIPYFFLSFSFLFHLLLSVLVLFLAIGSGQCCRRLLGVRASAPAFVFFHIVFIWVVYIGVIRQAVSLSMDMILNGELVMLLIGFLRILVSDPGFVRCASSLEDGAHAEELRFPESSAGPSTEVTSLHSRRVRYCRSCEAFVRGFDHHCPAFGNCIGQKNYALFMVLLVGFITTEASYSVCSYQWFGRYHILNARNKIYLYERLVWSTMLFSLLQVLWQVVFLTWHIYCVCFNIRTDEWINWRRYPEFNATSQLALGQPQLEMRFRNPYKKGIFYNLKDVFLTRD